MDGTAEEAAEVDEDEEPYPPKRLVREPVLTLEKMNENGQALQKTFDNHFPSNLYAFLVEYGEWSHPLGVMHVEFSTFTIAPDSPLRHTKCGVWHIDFTNWIGTWADEQGTYYMFDELPYTESENWEYAALYVWKEGGRKKLQFLRSEAFYVPLLSLLLS